MTDSHGTPLAVEISAANSHDVNHLVPLVMCQFPRVGGVVGRPPTKPKVVRADRGYTSSALLNLLAWCGIRAEIPQRGDMPTPGLGKLRWPVERTISWLKQYRRLGTRRDRTLHTFQSFLQLACSLIAYKQFIRKQF